ncbi:hypothetical protein QVD17_26279 [Tagetes erecta]|uniref:Uncharacterized protein n=1 Tax=Tagetes erecta TaxID=13708 RepID=A0AAD8K935_TARER|nr:hypothetical protein QVD17_26279 [Tagetes erecta]
MMSNKMKGVAFDSSSHGSFEDVRARFKHQTLVQDYLELQQETEAARNKLEAMKQKKHTLEAEVRFLRRRHRFLMRTNSSAPQQVKLHNVETTQYRKSKKDKVNPKKVATLPNLPPIPNQFQRGKTYSKKKNIVPSQPLPVFDLDRNVNLQGNNSFPVKESGFSGKAAVVQPRAPIFDLNQISVEEEELQESFEDQKKEVQNDLKLSICRNVGDGSTNRSGKRKISWQDPVALRV